MIWAEDFLLLLLFSIKFSFYLLKFNFRFQLQNERMQRIGIATSFEPLRFKRLKDAFCFVLFFFFFIIICHFIDSSSFVCYNFSIYCCNFSWPISIFICLFLLLFFLVWGEHWLNHCYYRNRSKMMGWIWWCCLMVCWYDKLHQIVESAPNQTDASLFTAFILECLKTKTENQNNHRDADGNSETTEQ